MSAKVKSKKPVKKVVSVSKDSSKAKESKPQKKKPETVKADSKMNTKKAAEKIPEKIAEKTIAEKATDKRRSQAAAAIKAAMAPEVAEEEFDPEAFFAASGGRGSFRAHVMRKERVDLNILIRFRFLTGPLVFNADLLNLSKGGLCLKTPQIVKPKTVVRVEIPLPHTSELFAVQAECVWSDYVPNTKGKDRPVHTGLRFLPMSLAKQTVINTFIQQRRDEIIMAKIGLDKFADSVPVAGLD